MTTSGLGRSWAACGFSAAADGPAGLNIVGGGGILEGDPAAVRTLGFLGMVSFQPVGKVSEAGDVTGEVAGEIAEGVEQLVQQ